ncbi:serine/threonine-protein kinase [Nocardioides daejeonensis]|uniref:serine/threonine-protein kinase n=1 Tax=Nocardioides daejeonensis TaxID=1046556 RepID=UPI000D74F2DD|nr:serine/threonine-protein kinase [Nocardioides daejeonensis]
MQQQVAGRYTLLREVGRGGMGAVWLARDEVLGREVALKRLAHREGLGATEERVQREARVSAMLNHAGVVAVFDLADDGDDLWLVMEYVDSVDLSTLVRREGPLSPDQTAPLMAQAAAALAAAHAAGIVHRDVKPGNMLVTRERQVKLGDFGIARTGADASLTATGLVTGSPGYLAPEVAAGGGATAASDVWSLGASIFHTLTGHPPYDTSGNLMGALYRLVHEEPPRTDRAGWLDPVLRGTMERDPQQRWSARDVQVFLAGGPGAAAAVPTRPAPPPRPQIAAAQEAPAAEQTQVFAPRRRTPLLAAVAVLLLAVLGVGGWLVLRDESSDPPATTAEPTDQASSTETTEPAPTPTRAEMEAFITDYLALVVDDPDAAFEHLTPAFQQTSGGLESYHGWWDTVRAAQLQQVNADPDRLTVTYRVHYKMKKGPDRVDDVTVDLAYEDGTYLINGEQ